MSQDYLSLQGVERAHQRIQGTVHHTAVFQSRLINERVGKQIFFKAENLQRGGAFKFRGASHVLALLGEEERKAGVVTHSSGNHAQALALAAQQAGIPATIIMPEGSNPLKIEGTRSYGARVVTCPNTQEDRERTAAHWVEKTGGVLVHPYDDPRIIAGAGTAALELIQSRPHDRWSALFPSTHNVQFVQARKPNHLCALLHRLVATVPNYERCSRWCPRVPSPTFN